MNILFIISMVFLLECIGSEKMYLDFKKNLSTEERFIRSTIGLLLLKLSYNKTIPKQQSNFLKVFSLFICHLLELIPINNIINIKLN